MPAIDPAKMKIGYVVLVAGGKPASHVLPADFDDPRLFEEVKDIWLRIDTR